MQLCAQAWANVIVDVPVAPPVAGAPPLDIAPPVVAEPPAALVPPVAVVPPAAVVPPVPVVLPLPQAKTQEATPNTRTSDPTLFFIMESLTENEGSRARRSSQGASSPADPDGAERLQERFSTSGKGEPPGKTGHRRSKKRSEGRRLERETEPQSDKWPPTPRCPQYARSVGPVHEVPRGQEIQVDANAHGHEYSAKGTLKRG